MWYEHGRWYSKEVSMVLICAIMVLPLNDYPLFVPPFPFSGPLAEPQFV